MRCHPCKLVNYAHYAALGNNSPATTVASDARFRTASSAALVTSDGETSPATTVVSDAKFRAAFPAALVTSDGEIPYGETPKMNWLLAAKGLLSANNEREASLQRCLKHQRPYNSGGVSEVGRSWSQCTSPVFFHCILPCTSPVRTGVESKLRTGKRSQEGYHNTKQVASPTSWATHKQP